MSEKQIKNCVLKMVVKNKLTNESPTNNIRNPESETSPNNSFNQSNLTQNEKMNSAGMNQLATLLGQLLKEASKEGHTHQIQPRDVTVQYPLPLVKDRKIKKCELQLWIYKMCREVFSCSFYNYEKGHMSYDQAKIYCSENIISNIVRCSQIAKFTEDEITTIDNQLKKNVLDYMLSKYPMTETVVVNKKIESVIKEIDNMQALENDAFSYSQNSFDFQYRENGNYNDLIMKLMNQMMLKVDSVEQFRSKKMRVFQHFYDTIQKFFESVQKKDWVEMMQSKSQPHEEKAKVQNIDKSEKATQMKKISDQKYQNFVKSYTHFLIGRKVSDNVPTYSDSQIKSGHLIIKHPAVLRILTKWCDELWTKFDTKNYFLEKSGNVKTLKGGNTNTYFGWMKKQINDLIQQEKVEINRFIDQLVKNNYDQQAIHLFRSLKANSFTNIDKVERSAGLFAVNTVDNLHSYIILYLNRVIHGLLSVSKKFYDKQLVKLARWISPPNLISFKISDLMRCKISSKERQIYCLFKHLLEISQKDPDLIKIVRIKNRLKQGTNDLLINIRFHKTHICQIQLAINSDHSNFIKCSNKFNHYIYQLQRSIFGPLTELCSIWISLDGRAKIYTKMAKANKLQSPQQLGGCLSKNKDHNMFNFNRPFVCNLCNQSYSHSNYIWPHQRCEDCGVFSKCARCTINNQKQDALKDKLFKGYEPYKKHVTKRKQNEDIPKYGICFLIQSKHLQLQRFVKLQIDGKVAIYTNQNKIEMITELASKKDIDNFKNKYIIFKLSQKMGKYLISINEKDVKEEYLLPQRMKKIYTKEQQQISFINEGINDALCYKILSGSKSERQRIKNIELQDNKLESLECIINFFPLLQVLSVSRNLIEHIDGVSQLKKLTSLNIRNNQIRVLPKELFTMKILKKLNIRGNLFTQLPEQLSNLTNLQKIEANELNLTHLPQSFKNLVKITYLDLSKNQFKIFPEEIKSLSKLKIFYISSNKIEVIPQWIGESLISLSQFKLNQNKIKTLPNSFQLLKIESLYMDKNAFSALTFMPPKSLKTLSIQTNSIVQIRQDFFQNGGILQKVDLRSNKLRNIPSTIGFCKKLFHIDLAQNNLQNLPQTMTELAQLQSLSLQANRFTQFPKMINNCGKLVRVSFSKNPLKYVDPNFFYNCFKIQQIDLSYTGVRILANPLGSCNALKFISLNATNILPDDLELLKELKYIETLNMSAMNLEKLPQAIKQLHYLQNFDISCNKIQGFDDDFFKKLTHLKKFNFDFNKVVSLPDSFKFCRRIKQVKCSHNNFITFPKQFFQFNNNQFPNIENIEINHNQITRIDSDYSLPKCLKQLQIKDNQLEAISDIFFKYADNLEKIELTGNKLASAPINLKNCEKLKQAKMDINLNQSLVLLRSAQIDQQQISLSQQSPERTIGTSRVITKLLMR